MLDTGVSEMSQEEFPFGRDQCEKQALDGSRQSKNSAKRQVGSTGDQKQKSHAV